MRRVLIAAIVVWSLPAFAAPSPYDLTEALAICRDQSAMSSFTIPCAQLTTYASTNPPGADARSAVHGLKGAAAAVSAQLSFITTIASEISP